MLTNEQLAMLEFEKKWWRLAGSKAAAIEEQFGMSATRYSQRLNQLLDMPEALVHDPILVNRLKRIRTQRTGARQARADLLTSMRSQRRRD